MNIIKNETVFIVQEHESKWTLSVQKGKVQIAYTVSKKDCDTFDKLHEYVLQTDLF